MARAERVSIAIAEPHASAGLAADYSLDNTPQLIFSRLSSAAKSCLGRKSQNEVLLAAASAAVSLSIIGCATPPDKVEASYVSSVLYQNLTCDQLGIEATHVSTRVAEVTGNQRGQRTTDTVVTSVGVVVFWPALFFIGGDDATTAELARLKGEMNAIEETSLRKGCSIEFRHTAPPTGTEQAAPQPT